MDLITKTIRENYKLLEIKKYICKKKTNLSAYKSIINWKGV